MGKRSNFERIEKDAYQTIDKRAVEALYPFLPMKSTFYEPCLGDGLLAQQLWDKDIRCVGGSDIKTGVDAMNLTSQDLNNADLIITNPPWSRQPLHLLIYHLSALKPTWLLFDSDWAYTKQSSDIMRTLCTDVVAVGRLIWIPDTKISGKDNTSWYKFDVNKNRDTIFHGR